MAEDDPKNSNAQGWVRATTTRSRLVLEMASELVTMEKQTMRQAKVMIKETHTSAWPITLYSASSMEGVHAMVKGEAQLSTVNPSAMLTLAYRGTDPFTEPQPVRTLCVIPTIDQYVFAVDSKTGFKYFEDIGESKYPLKVSVRDEPEHNLHQMLHHIMAASGFSVRDLESWGGSLRAEIRPRESRFTSFLKGDANAIFDEAVQEWTDEAMEQGLTILSLREETVRKLEKMGYRRGIIPKSIYKGLPDDVLTIDFSGWAVFVHADLSDDTVTQFCEALEARKHMIPWQGEGPLPLEKMCVDAPETPFDVPFHPAAERFWKKQGYL